MSDSTTIQVFDDKNRWLGYIQYDDFVRAWWVYDVFDNYLGYREDQKEAEQWLRDRWM